MRMKNAGPNLQTVIYTTIQEKKLYCEHMPSKACFPSYCLSKIKENAPRVHLEFPCRHCRRQTSGTLLSSTTSE